MTGVGCGRVLSCPCCAWVAVVIDADGVRYSRNSICEGADQQLDRVLRRPIVRVLLFVARLAARGSA